MIILDTNIISEFMVANPNSAVINWLNHQAKHQLFITSISIAEIRFGLQIMPNGKRKFDLTNKFEQLISFLFEQRILSFDKSSAESYSHIMANRRKLGSPMSNFDGQIAAISVVKNYSIATKNVKDFEFCSIEIINPFELNINTQ